MFFFYLFIYFFFIFFILAESGRGRRSIAEKEERSNGTIVPFVTFNDSRRDHKTCWLLDIRSLTNLSNSVISSPKTKGSVIPQAEWSWSEDSVNVSQGRTNVSIQPTPVELAVRKGGGASPAMQGLTDHLLGLLTRVSVCPICPINKCTVVWHNFSSDKFVFKLVMNLRNLSMKYSSIPIFAAMYAVNVTSPTQLPSMSGCRNSGDWLVFLGIVALVPSPLPPSPLPLLDKFTKKDTKKCQKVPTNSKRPKRCSKVLKCARKCQKVPSNVTKKCQKVKKRKNAKKGKQCLKW